MFIFHMFAFLLGCCVSYFFSWELLQSHPPFVKYPPMGPRRGERERERALGFRGSYIELGVKIIKPTIFSEYNGDSWDI